MNTRKDYRTGVLRVTVAATIWGFSYIFAKLVSGMMPPLILTFYLSLFASIGMLTYLRFKLGPLVRLLIQYPFHFLGLTLFGNLIANTLYFVALRYLDAGVCALLEKTQPIFVLMLASVVFTERITRVKVVYASVAILASFVIANPNLNFAGSESQYWIGVLAIISGAASLAVSSIIGKWLVDQRVPPTQLLSIRYLLGGLLLLPLMFTDSNPGFAGFIDKDFLISMIGLALAGVGGFLFFYHGLRHITAGLASLLELISPVVALGLGFAFLGESLVLPQVVAIPILLFAVYRLTLHDDPRDIGWYEAEEHLS